MKNRSSTNSSAPYELRATEVAEILGCPLPTALRGKLFSGVTQNSLEVHGGDLFVALPGVRRHGNHFVEDARRRGAAAALVESVDAPKVEGFPLFSVPNTLNAIERLGKSLAHRASLRIGITGSYGKTTLKRWLGQILPKDTYIAPHNYNGRVGLPMSLIRTPVHTPIGIYELGLAFHAGEIEKLAQLLRPHISIITAVGTAHGAHFPNREGIARAKMEIMEGMEKGGTVILPSSMPAYEEARRKASKLDLRVLSFGCRKGDDVLWRNPDAWPSPVEIILDSKHMISLNLSLLPDPAFVSGILAILAILKLSHLDPGAYSTSLEQLALFSGRGKIYRIPWGKGTVAITDETYNASPETMMRALQNLLQQNAGRRVALLGGMKRLGHWTRRAHLALLPELSRLDQAFLLGEEYDDLPLPPNVQYLDIPPSWKQWWQGILQEGDAVLIKGSRIYALDKALEELLQ